jgi:hypothetical protein
VKSNETARGTALASAARRITVVRRPFVHPKFAYRTVNISSMRLIDVRGQDVR